MVIIDVNNWMVLQILMVLPAIRSSRARAGAGSPSSMQ